MTMMNTALEVLERAFTFKDGGWLLFVIMVGSTNLMLWHWIGHWPFRLVAVPCITLAAALSHDAMREFGLLVSNDIVINYACGFGFGIVVAMIVLCTAAWSYYELAAD